VQPGPTTAPVTPHWTRYHEMSRPVDVSDLEFNGDARTPLLNPVCQETSNGGLHHSKEATMTKLKILSAIVILSAAIATPVFAQEASVRRPRHAQVYDAQVYDQSNFRGAYNQSNAPFYAQPLTNEERANVEDFGRSGRDPTRVGGEDPYLHPGG
jgi:hypothetical protein